MTWVIADFYRCLFVCGLVHDFDDYLDYDGPMTEASHPNSLAEIGHSASYDNSPYFDYHLVQMIVAGAIEACLAFQGKRMSGK